jgi:hypothetical protein
MTPPDTGGAVDNNYDNFSDGAEYDGYGGQSSGGELNSETQEWDAPSGQEGGRAQHADKGKARM